MSHEVTLDRMVVRLGTPQPVLEAVGHLWFPNVARFPSGNLMVTAILSADANDNLIDGYRVRGSIDGGKTWQRAYDVPGWGGGGISFIPQTDGSLAGPDYYVYPNPPDQARSLAGHFTRFDDGASRYSLEPYALRVEGLPSDVQLIGQRDQWSKDWAANLFFYGNPVEIDGEIVTTVYGRFAGDDRYSAILLASTDLGRTWRYRSIVGPPQTAPDAKEGPNESALIQLENGDLMCVMRVGRSIEGPIGTIASLARAYSSDAGQTWTTPDRLPVPGVAPSLRRLENGVIALATGRPGISLWFSDDPRGESWQEINLLKHHNAALDERHAIRPGGGEYDPNDPNRPTEGVAAHDQHRTTAYVDMAVVAPNRFLITYDRVPHGWRPVPTDADERNRIYVTEVQVDRA